MGQLMNNIISAKGNNVKTTVRNMRQLSIVEVFNLIRFGCNSPDISGVFKFKETN